MSVFIVSGKKELSGPLSRSVSVELKIPVYIFNPDFGEVAACEVCPSVIIILSEKNEAWGWWLATEFVFRYPDALHILTQVNRHEGASRKVTEKLFFLVGDEENIATEIMNIIRNASKVS